MKDLVVLSPLVELSASSWRFSASSWRSWLPPRKDLHFLTGFRHYDPASCIFLFPGGLFTTFIGRICEFCDISVVFWIVQRFLGCPPWTNLSWWCLRYGRTSLPTLQSEFMIHKQNCDIFSSLSLFFILL